MRGRGSKNVPLQGPNSPILGVLEPLALALDDSQFCSRSLFGEEKGGLCRTVRVWFGYVSSCFQAQSRVPHGYRRGYDEGEYESGFPHVI